MQQLLQWKINNYYILWVCVCSLRYPECKVHAPYCHLWPARLYNIFPHYFIHCKIFEKKKSCWKCNVRFDFCLQRMSETFLILRRNVRDTVINLHRSSCQIEFMSDWIHSKKKWARYCHKRKQVFMSDWIHSKKKWARYCHKRKQVFMSDWIHSKMKWARYCHKSKQVFM